jgi:hypothetical protein
MSLAGCARPSGVLLGLALTACAANPEPDRTLDACAGQFVLIVSNDWTEAVEIYTTRLAQTTPLAVGTVLPGAREEFLLPGDTRRAYALALSGGRVYDIPRQSRRLIRVRHQCR